jgi:delta 1-pyrroline-5-carboxylate dehydrogenase
MVNQLLPAVTFVLPVQNKQDLVIEQINSCFKFSKQHSCLCEIIIVTDDFEDKKVNLLWLAMELNKVNNPHMRTRMIRYTTKLEMNELIETGIRHALGQRIVVATNNSEDTERIRAMEKDGIIVPPDFFDIDTLKGILLKN